MNAGKPHVVHIGFHASEAHTVDFEADHVTVVMPRASAARLPAALAARFARIEVLDLPDSDDLDTYDRAVDRMRELVEDLVAQFGPPAAIVGLYEHTTLPAARLREHFGVPGTGAKTALLCRDKVPMKEALSGTGIRVPRFLAVGPDTPRAELSEFARGLPGRVVLKPRSQGASIGVRILDGAAELLALADAGGIEEGYEAEEFVDGSIYHIDGVVRDGEMRWFCASRYLDTCFDFRHGTAPLGAVTPDSPGLVSRMRDVTGTVLEALGLTDSTYHMELFHTPGDELVFLEIGNRFGGAGISWHQRQVYGVDLARESVLACLGRPSEVATPTTMLDHRDVGASGWLYMPAVSGAVRVVAVRGLDELPGSVVGVNTPSVGDVLDSEGLIWATAGGFLVRGDSTLAVERDMARIISTYTLETKAGD
ncbi:MULTISPECIES: ATP-grasp domain-containing protein [Streptomyces]|uniref:ATP-grasp domain-containing protein n=2 Tax=Streptomyces TaxID=1883 RepID=A0A8H9HKI3_9ACTN|nr:MULTISPECIES: hypothetical protein [Streptomyces]MDQ0293690.1 biotin carboxylase [Streptomyces sp. DSM 41037]WPR52891.1 hypothetical protein SJI45_19335 [Streptomyces sp. S399]SUO94215.1 putative biotin carboxylase [Streptomyces griseus]GFH80497.1 hypothetical protein Sgou_51670 [Streptomyces gougerotii]GGU71520.1 hypothetical protein GCM10010227_27260 [Streptomyces gougerotii]